MKGLRYEGFSLTTPYNNIAYTIEPSKKMTIAMAGSMGSPELKAATRNTTANRRHTACDSKRDRNTVISTRTSMDSVGKTYQVYHSNEDRN